jgi:hypothetical protein
MQTQIANDTTLVIGVLVEGTDAVAIAAAKRQFYNAIHCRGLTPTHAYFHPTQKPTVKENGKTWDVQVIEGLAVRTSDDVKINHVRVCAVEGE